MKGIILAGGCGTRLYPLTTVISKQLLPVYDKPMIYYPLSVLMDAGIRDILIISTPEDIGDYERLLGNGENFGVSLRYAVQQSPDGLAQALIIGENFTDGESCALILGDNMFYGPDLRLHLQEAIRNADKGYATLFAYRVKNPQNFGVIDFDNDWNVTSITEKPREPASDFCVTGLYIYDGRAPRMAKSLKPSGRNEIEITDLNRMYLEEGRLRVIRLEPGFTWFDMGTFDSLLDASAFVRDVYSRTGTSICSPEAVSYANEWITGEQLAKVAGMHGTSPYGRYLKNICSKNGSAPTDGTR